METFVEKNERLANEVKRKLPVEERLDNYAVWKSCSLCADLKCRVLFLHDDVVLNLNGFKLEYEKRQGKGRLSCEVTEEDK